MTPEGSISWYDEGVDKNGPGLAVWLCTGLVPGIPIEYAGVLYGLTPVVSSETPGSIPPLRPAVGGGSVPVCMGARLWRGGGALPYIIPGSPNSC